MVTPMNQTPTIVALDTDRLHIQFDAQPDRPVRWRSLAGTGLAPHPIVDIFTAAERHARSGLGYVRSALGERLRLLDHATRDDEHEVELSIRQRDPITGLIVNTLISVPHAADSARIRHVLTNSGESAIVVTAITSLAITVGSCEGDLDALDVLSGQTAWLSEFRWQSQPLREVLPKVNLPLHAQDGRGRFGVTSRGSWSSGEHVPAGALVDRHTGRSIGWHIESSAGWHWELGESTHGAYLAVLGLTDDEHQFAHRLKPGRFFESVAAVLAVSSHGSDGVLGELMRHTRLRRSRHRRSDALPVVFNDFMNTLMGDPTTEKLTPLIDAAAEAGAEYFCVDAGWFAAPDSPDWWSAVGDWREVPGRFAGGLSAVMDRIRARGMVPGLWLEPEVVGVDSAAASALPSDAFFTRFGGRIREHDRFHLDLRHPAARRHLDETVDTLVALYGIGFLKLDYNIDPGPGTDIRGTSAGDGLLGHTRAYRGWIVDVQRRHPHLLIENCASGAMRADSALLEVAHLQSTSDQQDYRLYPAVAASAPALIPPEQCGNWAYPAATMTDDETVAAMTAGVMGRMCLSGFLNTLRTDQLSIVRWAVAVHKEWRTWIAGAEPFWPIGLPSWEDQTIALGLQRGGQSVVAVWARGPGTSITMPGKLTTTIFPAGNQPVASDDGIAHLRVPQGDGDLAARIFVVTDGDAPQAASSRP